MAFRVTAFPLMYMASILQRSILSTDYHPFPFEFAFRKVSDYIRCPTI